MRLRKHGKLMEQFCVEYFKGKMHPRSCRETIQCHESQSEVRKMLIFKTIFNFTHNKPPKTSKVFVEYLGNVFSKTMTYMSYSIESWPQGDITIRGVLFLQGTIITFFIAIGLSWSWDRRGLWFTMELNSATDQLKKG